MIKKNLARIFSSVINYKEFRWLFIGLTMSQIGTNIQDIAQTWLIIEYTHTVQSVTIVTTLLFTPYAILGLFVGPFLEKFNARNIMLVCQVASMIFSIVLAVTAITNHLNSNLIYIIAFLRGVLIIFNNPARHLLIRQCVDRKNMQNAVSLNASVFNLSRIIGPMLGGMLLAWIGAGICFLINSISYLLIIFALLNINIAKNSTYEEMYLKNFWGQLMDGFVYIKKQKKLIFSFLLLIIISITCINFSVVLPILATNILFANKVQFGLVTSIFGIGAFLGSIASAWLIKPKFSLILVSTIGMGLTFVGVGLLKNSFYISCLIAILGFFYTYYTTITNSFLQLNTTERYQGRIVSLYSYVVTGTNPLGAILIGFILSFMGSKATFFVPGCIALVTSGLIYIFYKIK